MGQADQKRQHHGAVGLPQRILAGLAIGGAIAAALFVIVDRIDASGLAQERRALMARNADLTREAVVPGSALSCLEADAGPSLEKPCELSVFATAHSLASAVSFVGERIRLLETAQALARAGDAQVLGGLRHEREAIERDRFGIAAHVLSRRYGCTAESCAAFPLFKDTGRLKADLQQRPFDALVTKYEGIWDKPGEARTPVAGANSPADALAKSDSSGAPHPLDDKWKLPSSDSIPAVSIMTPEPKVPKAEPQPESKSAERKQAEPKPEQPRTAKQAEPKPEPPRTAKRPQAEPPAPAEAR